MAEDPVEDVADPDTVRRRVAPAESAEARKLGPRPNAVRHDVNRRSKEEINRDQRPMRTIEEAGNKEAKKALAKRENI